MKHVRVICQRNQRTSDYVRSTVYNITSGQVQENVLQSRHFIWKASKCFLLWFKENTKGLFESLKMKRFGQWRWLKNALRVRKKLLNMWEEMILFKTLMWKLFIYGIQSYQNFNDVNLNFQNDVFWINHIWLWLTIWYLFKIDKVWFENST